VTGGLSASRFAVGVYGFDMEVLRQRGWWKTLKKALQWTRKKTSQDAVNKCVPELHNVCIESPSHPGVADVSGALLRAPELIAVQIWWSSNLQRDRSVEPSTGNYLPVWILHIVPLLKSESWRGRGERIQVKSRLLSQLRL